MNTSDLMAWLDRGSQLVNQMRDAGHCPIRLSGTGSCARAIALRMQGAPWEHKDPTGARIVETGQQRGYAHELGLKMVAESEGDDAPFGVNTQVNVWCRVPGTFTSEEIERLMGLVDTAHGDSPTLRPVQFREGDRVFVRGNLDAALCVDGVTHLIDFKTKNGFSMKYVDPLNAAESVGEQYLLQMGAYCAGFRDTYPKDELGDAFVVYEDKNSSELRACRLDYEGDIVPAMDEARERLALHIRNAIDGKLPERPFAPNGKGYLPWNCNYCHLWQQCWGDEVRNTSSKRVPSLRVV